jgi:hypothetical protein
MKTQEEYAQILNELMAANTSMRACCDETLSTVLVNIAIPELQRLVLATMPGMLTDIGVTDPIARLQATVNALPMLMFELGVLYGRREAAEAMNEGEQ